MIERGMHRDRKLLDLAHEAPCMLLLGATGCGAYPSVPCHSDLLEHGRGASSKSHDCYAVPGCPPCHALFTRARLGQEKYREVWRAAHEKYQLWLWRKKKIRVA